MKCENCPRAKRTRARVAGRIRDASDKASHVLSRQASRSSHSRACATMSSFAMRAASNAASCSFTAPFARARDVSRGSRLRARALSREDAERMYLTLGVSPGASPEAVKRAYKRLAKQLHPDVCADADADARFTAVCEAYNALANERGTLANVGTEAWRMKWAEQIRVMREVEAGATAVNVRRRRVARAATKTRQTRGAHDTDDHDDTDDTDDTDASHAVEINSVRRETIEELERAFEDDEKETTAKKTRRRMRRRAPTPRRNPRGNASRRRGGRCARSSGAYATASAGDDAWCLRRRASSSSRSRTAAPGPRTTTSGTIPCSSFAKLFDATRF